MADVLLRELSNTDIDWLIATGHQQEVAAGTTLIEAGVDPNTVYVLLQGCLTINRATEDCPEKALPESNDGSEEIIRLAYGEIIGETCLLNARPLAAHVKVVENSLVLVISQETFLAKLQDDQSFSAHLYRAIALILSERLRQMLEMPEQIGLTSDAPLKEAMVMFGELQDSDVDWLLSVGHLQTIAPNQTLIQAGRPVEALHIVLDGSLLALVSSGDRSLLSICFGCQIERASEERAIGELSKGELIGTISFLDFRPSPLTVNAVQESLVLSIPRQPLSSKLQHDIGFAARFYRILATQLLEHLQTALEQVGCLQQTYSQESNMDEMVEYDDELDTDDLHQLSQGAARFNWMLKRLGVICSNV